MSEVVKIKRKYNVTIPKKVRKRLEVKVGQLVQVSLDGDTIVLKPFPKDPSEKLEELIGTVKAQKIKEQAERISVKESKVGLAKKLKLR